MFAVRQSALCARTLPLIQPLVAIGDIVNQEKSIINCPQCGEEIDVNDILYHQVESSLKKSMAMNWLKKKKNMMRDHQS